jgi:hypothetical protein
MGSGTREKLDGYGGGDRERFISIMRRISINMFAGTISTIR